MFSVVIPLYNKAHTIERTLSSVLTQTFKVFEVVIVNDGSTDNGVEVIGNFTGDPRVRTVTQANRGVSAARNRGVAESIYDYVAFIDGDDEWMPCFLEKMKEAIELYPHAGMYGSASWHLDSKTGEGNETTLLRYKGKIQEVEYFENPGVMPHTSAVVVSKKIFSQIDAGGEGFPAGMKCCEDWACFYRMAMLAPVVYAGYPLGIRNENVEGQITGVSGRDEKKYFPSIVNFYALVFDFWVKSGCKNKLYPVFLKYDLRCRFLGALRDNDHYFLTFLLQNLNLNILKWLTGFELFLYRKRFRVAAISYIYFTKILWRRHKFPIVGNNK
jgi:glycosyltransferase involved in cell wall biosynthesis